MKLVYVSNSELFSGHANAVHVACMCDALAGEGVDVRLRARRPRGVRSGQADAVRDYGLRHDYPIDFENKLEHRLWLARKTWIPRRADASILHYGRNLPALARLGDAGHAVALELHFVPRDVKWPLVERFVRARRFVGLVVISDALRSDLLDRLPGLAPEAVHVAPDGYRESVRIAPRDDAPHPGDALRAVYAGSFHPGKGVEAAIAAARRLPAIEFHLYGGAPEDVRRLARDAPANARFHGRIPHAQVAERLADCDLALAPYGTQVHGANQKEDSHSLGRWMSPLKLFEYAAAGVPIVTSDLPVIREIFAPGEHAEMVPPDDGDALVAAIDALARDPARRRRLADAASARLRDYSWEARARRLLAFLRSRGALG